LEKEINNFISTEIEWIPLNSVEISNEKNEDLINFFEKLEEDDDVQNIYTNAKLKNKLC
jgi:transcriptional/translational regulatory protein YebC/TACO1